MLQVAHLAKKVDPLPGLSISEPLGVLELGGQAAPVLAQRGRVPLGLLELVNQVAVLDRDLPLGAIGLMESPLELLKPALGVVDLLLDHLALLLKRQLLTLVVGQVLLGLLQLESNCVPLLLSLGLGLVLSVDLFTHLSNGTVVLLSQHGQRALMGDVGLVELHLELGKLLLAPRVEGDLGGGVAASLLKLLVQLIKLSAKGAAALVKNEIIFDPGTYVCLFVIGHRRRYLVSPGTRDAFSLKLLIKLLLL